MRDWSKLTKWERSKLVNLEIAQYQGGGPDPYLPDGYSECGYCSQPSSGGLCQYCLEDLIRLAEKVTA